jgi:hypothetical protein
MIATQNGAQSGRWFKLLLAALLMLCGAAWLFVDRLVPTDHSGVGANEPQRQDLAHSAHPSETADNTTRTVHEGPVEVSTGGENPAHTPPRSRSMRSILADYWGDRWASMEPLYLEQLCGIAGDPQCLDNLATEHFRPWEIAASEIESKFLAPTGQSILSNDVSDFVGWPSEQNLNASALRSALRLPAEWEIDDDDVHQLNSLVRNENLLLEQLGMDQKSAIHAAIRQKWSRGDFERAPFFVPDRPNPEALHNLSLNDQGWGIRIVIEKHELPWVQDLIAQADALRATRARRVWEYFQQRK